MDGRVRTLDPICVHLDDLVDELDGKTAFALGLFDLCGISALVVDKVENIEGHGGG